MKNNFQTRQESGEWPISKAMEHGISLEESKRRVENVIYDHFHSRVCA
jgi:hypothetical protein